MKFQAKAIVAAVAFAVAGGANAAILGQNQTIEGSTQFDGELFISIFRDTTTPESMIIDTGVSLLSLQSGATTTWSSSAAQTAAILSFLGTADISAFRFNAGGVTNQTPDGVNSGPNSYDGFFTTVSPTVDPDIYLGGELNTPRSNIGSFITQVNNGFNMDANFNTNGLATGMNPGEPGYHYAPLWGNNLGGGGADNENAVGTLARLINVLNADPSDPYEFGFQMGWNTVGFLDIDAVTGVASLSQGATVVPVPAAAWLLGSGLVGLAGVARRRKA